MTGTRAGGRAGRLSICTDSIQETFVTLMEMILGLLFTYTLPDDEYETDNNNNNQFKCVMIIWFALIVLILQLIHTISNWDELILTSKYILNKINKNKLAVCKSVSEKENVWCTPHVLLKGISYSPFLPKISILKSHALKDFFCPKFLNLKL